MSSRGCRLTRRLALALFCLLAAAANSSAAANAATASERLDAALQRSWQKSGSPGVQATVLRRGRLVWQGALGQAVIGSRPVTDQTIFEFASFSKMVLAAFAMDRVQAGRLALDAPIRRYVGRAVPGSARVTLRMLLSHTAGYPDVYARPPVSVLLGAKYDPNRSWSFKTVFRALGPPRHPGHQWEYSNSGYIILAYLLTRTTNRPLADAIAEFLEPAGSVAPIDEGALTMRRTPEAASLFAHGYRSGEDAFAGARLIPTDLYGLPWGDGLFAGTSLGAAEFLDGLLVGNRLLPPSAVGKMVAPSPQSRATTTLVLPHGGSRHYGFGTYRFVAAGRTWQGHDGSYVGYSTMGFTDRSDGVTIFVAANGSSFGQPAISIWGALARAYFAD